jgi:protein TonB
VSTSPRLLVCAILSVAGHYAFARGLGHLPRHLDPPAVRKVSIRVIAPPPAPEPPPEPARAPDPTPKSVPHERPHARPAPTVAHAEPTPRTPPPPEPTATVGDSDTPVFGVTMESTSASGSGPALPVGNSGRPQAARAAAPAAKPLMPPVPAYEVTTMPLPKGRCQGRYTEEAKAAAIEGTVVLDLVVDETGKVREVHVVSGLGHGLTEAAIAAIKDCRFSPGEKDGVAVPVRLPGFKFRFYLQDDD